MPQPSSRPDRGPEPALVDSASAVAGVKALALARSASPSLRWLERVRRFIRFHSRLHPRELGAAEVVSFVSLPR